MFFVFVEFVFIVRRVFGEEGKMGFIVEDEMVMNDGFMVGDMVLNMGLIGDVEKVDKDWVGVKKKEVVICGLRFVFVCVFFVFNYFVDYVGL